MKRVAILTVLTAFMFAGCDDLRDLYVMVGPNIHVGGDWEPSLGRKDMTMDATVALFDGGGVYAKDYFFAPDNVTVDIDRGGYDVLIFNGLMYAPEDTHLDGIYFRGTDRFDTFEAYAGEAEANKRLHRSEGEYIATNNMEIFTSASERVAIERAKEYFIKYENGRNGFEIPESYTEAELHLVPQAMNYPCKVTIRITNITSAYAANAALYGFTGSAWVGTRRPTDFMVTHQFNLNSKKMLDKAADIGTIESPEFVTFGPPLDMSGRKCSVYVNIMMTNGVAFEREVDVTDQVLPFVAKANANFAGVSPIDYRLSIPIEIDLDLPVVEPVEGHIGLGDWDDDEIITIPIKQ